MRDAKTFGITPSKTTAAASRVTVARCKKSDRHAIHRFRSRERRCIDKNRFQHEKVIIQRDETANEAKRDEPKKRVICVSM